LQRRCKCPQLRILVTGLISARDKSYSWTHFPAAVEAIGVFKGEDKSQRSEWTHTANRTEQSGLRVAFAAKLFVLLVIGLDLLGEGSDGVKDRSQGRLQGLGDVGSDFASEAVCGTRGQTRAGGFHEVAGVVDEQGAAADEGIPRAQDGQVSLCLG